MRESTRTALVALGGCAVGFSIGYFIGVKGGLKQLLQITSTSSKQQDEPPRIVNGTKLTKEALEISSQHAGVQHPLSINGGGRTSGVEPDGGLSVAVSGDLSPTASVAGSVMTSFSMPATPQSFRGGAASFRHSSSDGGGNGVPRGDKLKMVVVVRDDILSRWGQSKLAVMISSCILGLYKRNYKNRELRASLLTWEAQKGAKVVLRCPDEAALNRVMDTARAAGVAAHCLLEMAPGGSPDEAPCRTRAIVALGPASHTALVAAGCQALSSL